MSFNSRISDSNLSVRDAITLHKDKFPTVKYVYRIFGVIARYTGKITKNMHLIPRNDICNNYIRDRTETNKLIKDIKHFGTINNKRIDKFSHQIVLMLQEFLNNI